MHWAELSWARGRGGGGEEYPYLPLPVRFSLITTTQASALSLPASGRAPYQAQLLSSRSPNASKLRQASAPCTRKPLFPDPGPMGSVRSVCARFPGFSVLGWPVVGCMSPDWEGQGVWVPGFRRLAGPKPCFVVVVVVGRRRRYVRERERDRGRDLSTFEARLCQSHLLGSTKAYRFLASEMRVTRRGRDGVLVWSGPGPGPDRCEQMARLGWACKVILLVTARVVLSCV
jgi:hypothetical protein